MRCVSVSSSIDESAANKDLMPVVEVESLLLASTVLVVNDEVMVA